MNRAILPAVSQFHKPTAGLPSCVRLRSGVETAALAAELASLAATRGPLTLGRHRLTLIGEDKGEAPTRNPALDQLPLTQAFLDSLGGKIVRAHLSAIEPGRRIDLHTDGTYRGGLFERSIRLHLPLTTHQRAYIYSEGALHHMRVGELWALDNLRPHGAVNCISGGVSRVHLIVDVEPDADLLALFRDAPPTPAVQDSEALAQIVTPERGPRRPRELARAIADQVERRAWLAWTRLRHRARFAEVQRFVLFAGYPRSGHSIVGACLDAHRHAVIAHELNAPALLLDGKSRDELYARILEQARWFHARGHKSVYDYAIPGLAQGRFDELRVVGDKRGGAFTRAIANHPSFVRRLRATVDVPLRVIHVVRNPYDNIAAISIRHRFTLDESIDYYFFHAATNARLGDLFDASELTHVGHEQMIADPRGTLTRLAEFIRLDAEPAWLDGCAKAVFAKPTGTRKKVTWSAEQVERVARESRRFPHLGEVSF